MRANRHKKVFICLESVVFIPTCESLALNANVKLNTEIHDNYNTIRDIKQLRHLVNFFIEKMNVY
jgi:hypothetical protein